MEKEKTSYTIYKVVEENDDLNLLKIAVSDSYYKIWSYAMEKLFEDGKYTIVMRKWDNDKEFMKETIIREINIKGGNKNVWNIENENKDI